MDFLVVFEDNNLSFLLVGFIYTIIYTLLGFLLSITIGLLVAFGELSKKKIIKALASAYLSWFRSTPLLVQLVLIYYGFPILFNIQTEPWVCGIIALGMYSGAYVSQVVRGAIISIDKGQMEAGRSLGYSHNQTMLKIILPQALRRMIAPMTNELISLTKNSSLLSTITVAELFRKANTLIAKNFKTIEIYILVAVLYYLINNLFGIIGKMLECKLRTGEELQ
ncbi:amino acid ABC transporter permease [Clostridium sp. BJN0001]|uniref:amino acid ABC transporter permease n=1 Tax=Clostridium sp. BJN0001 TaxID=2930219 RepID=UPI001FD42AAC|nr:amino acid ABC transporter permease [Clostridium sp. BJN0001]